MPTIVDSLIMTLGLDDESFGVSANNALRQLDELAAAADKAAKDAYAAHQEAGLAAKDAAEKNQAYIEAAKKASDAAAAHAANTRDKAAHDAVVTATAIAKDAKVAAEKAEKAKVAAQEKSARANEFFVRAAKAHRDKQIKDEKEALEKSKRENEKFIKDRQDQVSGAIKLIGVLAAAATGASLASFFTGTLESANSLRNMSDNLQMSVEDITSWQRAADRAGGSAGDMTASLAQAQSEIAKARRGLSDDAMQSTYLYAGLSGVKITPIHQMRQAGDLLLAQADILHKMYEKNPGDAQFAASQMGISPDQFNLLKQGREAVLGLIDAQRKNTTMTRGQAEELALVRNRWADFKDEMIATGSHIVVALIPAITRIEKQFERLAVWIDAHRGDIADWIDKAVAAILKFIEVADEAAKAVGGWGNALLILGGLKILSMSSSLLSVAASLAQIGNALGLIGKGGAAANVLTGVGEAGAVAGTRLGGGLIATLGELATSLGLLAAAGAVGYAIGSVIYNSLSEEMQGRVGKLITQTLALAGNTEAQETLGQHDHKANPVYESLSRQSQDDVGRLVTHVAAAFGSNEAQETLDRERKQNEPPQDGNIYHDKTLLPGEAKAKAEFDARLKKRLEPSFDARLKKRLEPSFDAKKAAMDAEVKYGVPAAVTLAQYKLESDNGRHMPVGSNNPFGIKATKGQPYVEAETHETVNGIDQKVIARFAKFDSLEAAFDAHAKLLATSPYYAEAKNHTADPLAYADSIAKNYATDPNYAAKLKQTIVNQGDVSTVGPTNVSTENTASTTNVTNTDRREIEVQLLNALRQSQPDKSAQLDEDVIVYVVRKLVKLGWTKEQAAGIAANMTVGQNENGPQYTLGKPTADDEQRFVKRFGHSIAKSTVEEQLSFATEQLNEGSKRQVGQRLKQASTINQVDAVLNTQNADNILNTVNQHNALQLAQTPAQVAAMTSTDNSSTTHNTASTDVRIGTMNINAPQAKNVDDIAAQAQDALKRHPLINQAITGIVSS